MVVLIPTPNSFYVGPFCMNEKSAHKQLSFIRNKKKYKWTGLFMSFSCAVKCTVPSQEYGSS